MEKCIPVVVIKELAETDKILTALKRLGVSRRQAAVVGDQLFTDSLGAHLSGITAIILDPILPETMWGFRLKRYLEKILYSFYKF